MTALQIIFYLFSATAVFSALMVVASPNPVRGALFLVLTFFSMAALWILLHAEFLALILVLVYVGAVMTLFLFVVMMLSVSRIGAREGFVRYLPLVVLIVLSVLGLTLMVVSPHQFGLAQMPAPAAQPADYSNTASLGMLLYTKYAYPFEVAAVLLLTAIVAAISLTHRVAPRSKAQRAAKQIAARAEDRVRLIKMQSEPKQRGS
jgi:NADH-quinone oxidoreductase subunit J